MIEVRDLHFSYPDYKVLRGTSFEVSTGEIFGILGPNGAGKTTLLKVLCRLLMPQSGSVVVDGTALGGLSRREIARKIAFVPQSEEVFLPFRVEQVVLMGRYPYVSPLGIESPRDFEAARLAMEATSTWDLRDRDIRELSGGERQRVFLARAVAQETPILLMDEPTSHLDIRYQTELMELTSQLNREKGMTLVMSLHDLNLASLYCNRLLLMEEGKIFAIGSAAEVLTQEKIRALFHAQVRVEKGPNRDAPMILPQRRS